MENKWRAYYKPDMETEDWPLYFYLQLTDRGYKWVCDKDGVISYDVVVTLLDPDWSMELLMDKSWVPFGAKSSNCLSPKEADLFGLM